MRMTYVEAMASALYRAAAENADLLFIGNGFVGLDVQAREAFSDFDRDFADRVVPKPVSELGLAGAAIGAAVAGSRTMVDLATADFLYQAFPQIVDEAAPLRYSTNGGASAPVTFYAMAGIRGAGGPQHSARPQAMLAGVPGLQVVLPSSPADVDGLLRWSLLHSQDPTVFLTHPKLFAEEEDVDPDAPPIPFGQARVRREGDDATVVATSVMVPRALEAADALTLDGVSVEVVDPRSLSPLDVDALGRSATKTGRVVVADECHRSFGAAAELACVIGELCWSHLHAPVARVATPDVPVPYSQPLEAELVVSAAAIADAVRGVIAAP
jgi:acetoin:2,6-dichlorophenolindophenol oxidoreductase subunit beta